MLFSGEQIHKDIKKVLSFIIPTHLKILQKDEVLYEYSNFQPALKRGGLSDVNLDEIFEAEAKAEREI